MKIRSFLVVAAVPFALACESASRRAAPTAPLYVASPGLDASASVSGAGAIVVRDERRVFFFNFDEKHQLLAVHMPVWDLALCGGADPLDLADRTVIITPSEIQQFLVHITDAESSVGVYHATSPADAGIGSSLNRSAFCSFITSDALVAQGTVHHVQNLSNASFESHWGGQLTAPDGATFAYSESYQLTADAHAPNDASQWVEHVADIRLSRLPH